MVKDEMKEFPVKFAAVRARLASRRAHNQRGSVLVEALVMALVGAMAMGGYLAVTTGTQNTVRHHQSVDVIDQFATGQIEEMRALPWSAVANCSADPSNPGHATDTTDDWVAATGDVYHSTCPTRYVKYYETATVQKINLTVTTRVSWDPVSASPTPTLPGRKKIVLTLTWKPIGSADQRSRTLTTFRSSTPSEAVPFTLPADGSPL